MVLKAQFLIHTENFDTKDIVKLYMNVADSSVLLLWLTDRDAEKKVVCNQQKLLVYSRDECLCRIHSEA